MLALTGSACTRRRGCFAVLVLDDDDFCFLDDDVFVLGAIFAVLLEVVDVSVGSVVDCDLERGTAVEIVMKACRKCAVFAVQSALAYS